MSEKESKWRSRVAAWRASGQTAEVFADGKEFTAGTLRWWSSRLRRADQKPATPAIRLARVVGTSPDARPTIAPPAGLIIELLDAGARITIAGRVDQRALSAVIAALREVGR